MRVKLWGVRGSIPTPLNSAEYRDRLKGALAYARAAWTRDPELSADGVLGRLPPEIGDLVGGETTCIEVLHEGAQLIIDMGTGARRLGYDMFRRGIKGDVHVLMTHTHWDHIQGWPFFGPSYVPGNRIHFYSALENCHERFQRQQHFDHFPVEFDATASEKIFVTHPPGASFQIGPFLIRTESLMHPGGSTAYRIEAGGAVFVFATDTEFFGEDLPEQIEARRPFFEGADLLVMDAQYSMEEAQQKIGWGHTAMMICVDCAVHWKAKRLTLTHHEPAHLDDKVRSLFAQAQARLAEKKPAPALDLRLAIELDEYEL